MAISKEVLVNLGRDVNTAIATVGAQFGASTKEVFGFMAKAGCMPPGDNDQARYRILGILAEHGYPGAAKGEQKTVKRYGKMVKVQPWVWRLVAKDDLDAWASGAGPTPRVNVSAKTRELEQRIEALEKTVAEVREAVYNSGQHGA